MAESLSIDRERSPTMNWGADMKPTLFIGSSSEALPVAEAIYSLLEQRGIDPTLWNQGVFGLNTSGLEAMMQACRSYDYACFVLRRDDVVLTRGRRQHSTRDNVLLELGLFLGALGRERVFVVFEMGNKPDLPSDLEGITFLGYDPARVTRGLQVALLSPCIEIARLVENRGHRPAGALLSSELRAGKFRVSPLDAMNSRWQNMTQRLNRCVKGETVRFISITGKNFLLPNFQEGETVNSRLGPQALSRGIKLCGIVLDPEGVEAEFRSLIESPQASRGNRLLVQDAQAVMDLPAYYDERFGLARVRKNLKLKYSPVGLSFGLWLFSNIAFVEPFHFGKRGDVQHLCGFAQLAVEEGTEEFELLKKHFEVLWRHAKYAPWCQPRESGQSRDHRIR